MSPAKRLSRQRFRALCERCRAYTRYEPGQWRAFRHFMALARRAKAANAAHPYDYVFCTMDALARLARCRAASVALAAVETRVIGGGR